MIEECEETASNGSEEETVDEDTNVEASYIDEDIKEALAEDSKFFWPCAPDCYIPNSIVRDIIKPVKPPDYSAVIRELDAKQASERFFQGMFLFILLYHESSIKGSTTNSSLFCRM